MNRLRKSFSVLSVGVLAAAAITLLPPETTAQDEAAGRKFAFLVGVEKYSHGKLANLEFPENDVEELAGVLEKQGFKTVLLTTRLGKTDAARMPTQHNVIESLRKFITENKPTKRDLMLIGLAGHGMQPLGSDESYFCPADANPTIKEGTKNSPANPDTLLSIGEMLKTLDDSGVGYKLLIVDACRNDPSVRGRRGVDHVNVAALPEQTGVLLSCKAGEFSFEHKSLGRGHGAFFFQVIEGLKGKAKDEEGDVTWDSLGAYVRRKVPLKVRELFGTEGGEQSPNLIGNINGAPAVLASITATPGNAANGNAPADKMPPSPVPLLNVPFDQAEARAARTAWANHLHIDEELKNSLGMELVLIPAGQFMMGNPESDDDLVKDYPTTKKEKFQVERPPHPVALFRPFYLAKYEVTRGQFKLFVDETDFKTDCETNGKGAEGYTGNKKKTFEQRPTFTWRDWGVDQSDNSPVVNVSWNDAKAFCDWLSRKEGKKYRLPSEAQWEYAARAGTTSRHYGGDDINLLTKIGNVYDATTNTMFGGNIGLKSSDGWAMTSPVGRFRPNNFDLYDMIGNASEWCGDWLAIYSPMARNSDPTGPYLGAYRVIRGGGWLSFAECRSASRSGRPPEGLHHSLGFRVSMVAVEDPFEPYVGLSIKDVDAAFAQMFNLPSPRGAVVSGLYANSPAQKAGFQALDVITEFNGKEIRAMIDVQRAIRRIEAAKPYEIRLLRDGKPLTISITAVHRPEESPRLQSLTMKRMARFTDESGGGMTLDELGIETKPVSPETASWPSLQGFQGVVVANVKPKSPAADAGLKPGLFIESLNGNPVNTPEMLEAALKTCSLKKGLLVQGRTAGSFGLFAIQKR